MHTNKRKNINKILYVLLFNNSYQCIHIYLCLLNQSATFWRAAFNHAALFRMFSNDCLTVLSADAYGCALKYCSISWRNEVLVSYQSITCFYLFHLRFLFSIKGIGSFFDDASKDHRSRAKSFVVFVPVLLEELPCNVSSVCYSWCTAAKVSANTVILHYHTWNMANRGLGRVQLKKIRTPCGSTLVWVGGVIIWNAIIRFACGWDSARTGARDSSHQRWLHFCKVPLLDWKLARYHGV